VGCPGSFKGQLWSAFPFSSYAHNQLYLVGLPSLPQLGSYLRNLSCTRNARSRRSIFKVQITIGSWEVGGYRKLVLTARRKHRFDVPQVTTTPFLLRTST
jgi:hypothetical protein